MIIIKIQKLECLPNCQTCMNNSSCSSCPELSNRN
jgi:hypothetical protein